MDIDFNLLKTFTKVSELGSFTKAALILNQPKSRVSRAISRLEKELGVELIRRTTRKISLTNSGQEFYNNITKHLNGINNELTRVTDIKDEMVGTIRITTSDSFAQTLLAQVISEYNLKYPKVKFEMLITNEYLDLIKENIDLAFRAGKLKDSTLIQKKFSPSTFILICSKSYAEKYTLPTNLKGLEGHKFLSFKPMEQEFIKAGINLDDIITTNSLPMLLKMALNGNGISIVPDFLCQKHLERNELVRVLPTWKKKAENIHILYPPTKNLSKKVREFIEIAKNTKYQ